MPFRLSTQLRWRRPHIRVRMRTLTEMILLSACGMGWMAYRARVQREAVAAVRRVNGGVRYEWQAVSKDGLIVYDSSPRAPKWLVDMIGVDYFGSVVGVSVVVGHRPPDALVARIAQLNRLEELGLCTSLLTDEDMAQIGSLTSLRKLGLNGRHLTERGMSQLGRLNRLEILTLQGASVSDAEVLCLAKLTRLKRLDLRGTQLSDAGLAHLKNLANLKVLMISGPRFTDVGVGGLLGALPNLTIVAPDRRDLDPVLYPKASRIALPMPRVAQPAGPRPLGQGEPGER
jgi:hypothetical protein